MTSDVVLDRIDLDSLARNAESLAERLGGGPERAPNAVREEAWSLLDVLRRPTVLRRIAASGETAAWSRRILALVERSDLTVGPLFFRRAEAYGSKTLFEIPGPGGERKLSWRQSAARVESLAKGLLTLLDPAAPGRVAILSDNRIEMALVDLACLSAGIVNVLVPANATDADVAYMLGHSGASVAVVGSAELLEKVLLARDALPTLRWIVVMDRRARAEKGIVSLDEVASRGASVPRADLDRRIAAVRSADLATVMYTSGTTGSPKGIQFSHRNVVFKRFARALAIPEIGEGDVFLCYLPLYHTFGRFLELLGCVFWGATYCFLDNPSVEALVSGMRRHLPTVFISVPKKWIQLHAAIAAEADLDAAPEAEIREATRRVTGGRLRWGLSAAGQLDPEIFRFFQGQGIELMSGFGMTEATGGITMTPPGKYKDDSLGPALPGIELRLAPDGELAIRGPYVMMGYLSPEEGDAGIDDDGWFATGDLMEMDSDGYIRLIDRKKEIYKNIKGETIAPQRIENLFRDFESVGRVFLVGDHREYNTALIWPNRAYAPLDLRVLPPEGLKAHFRSIVSSVNGFLAPFERIVDFAILDRDLDAERGELTAKGTPKRKVVEKSFEPLIRLLYRRSQMKVGGVEVVFPNWLFQALGMTAQDLTIEAGVVRLPSGKADLHVRRLQKGFSQLGSCLYRHPPDEPLNLGVLLRTPRLWLGNESLVDLATLDVAVRERPGRAAEGIEWVGRPSPFAPDEAIRRDVEAALKRKDLDLIDLHRAALLLGSRNDEAALLAIRLLERVLSAEEGDLADPARLLLGRTAAYPTVAVRRRAFEVLVPAERESRFPSTLRRFLEAPGVTLDPATGAALCERDLPDEKIEALLAAAEEASSGPTGDRGEERRASSLLRFLAQYGAQHPTRYRRLRAFLVRMTLFADRDGVRAEAARAAESLERGFRDWLGKAMRVAVDPETGHEYRWPDVVAFEDGIEEEDRTRLLGALRETMLLREAVFLFSGGTHVRLSDIPPGGVNIRLLGSRHGKCVYRVTVQTRFQGSYDFAVNLNHDLAKEQVKEEMNWLILSAASQVRDPLVEDFGGYWPEHDLWSEEFVPGETLDRAMRRISRQTDVEERLPQLWPFFAWSALSAYVDFWNRTGKRWEISDPSMSNVIVPTHDYQTGARIVSVSSRKPHAGLIDMMRGFREGFVQSAERDYPFLAGNVGWDLVFSSVLEILGEEEGVRALLAALQRDGSDAPQGLKDDLWKYVGSIEARGFLPMRLMFAVKRYRRWAALSAEPTQQARARTLQELWDTYGLQRLTASYPETRVRFFRETVFTDAPKPLSEGLEDLIARLRRGDLRGDELTDAVADLRAKLELGPDDDAFLARLSFPYLRPEDAAGFVRVNLGGRHQTEMVVTLEDEEGTSFQVRHALNPREVGRLHRLFVTAKLDVNFRPEHQYLVALNERSQIIGGIFYEVEEDGASAHLEKIVVAERFRKKGVADGLMSELFNRLSAMRVKTVTTGFFRPEFFYAYGFAIEKRYAGLVKNLE
jgi:long-subunit acyl-CoA synthetase (AMP-forming)